MQLCAFGGEDFISAPSTILPHQWLSPASGTFERANVVFVELNPDLFDCLEMAAKEFEVQLKTLQHHKA